MAMLGRLLNPLSPGKAMLGMLDPARGYKAAQVPMQQYYEQAQGQMQPYVQQGQAAYAPMQNAMTSLLNPQQLHSEWMQGYETSPYAQQLAEQANQSGLNAASSMGLMGSTPALQALQAGTSQIVARDRDNYLNNLMQKYMSGAQLAQGLYGQGANMAGMMGQHTMQHGNQLAEMMYGRHASRANMLGGMIGTGLGFALGGPMGGAIGGTLGGGMMGGGK